MRKLIAITSVMLMLTVSMNVMSQCPYVKVDSFGMDKRIIESISFDLEASEKLNVSEQYVSQGGVSVNVSFTNFVTYDTYGKITNKRLYMILDTESLEKTGGVIMLQFEDGTSQGIYYDRHCYSKDGIIVLLTDEPMKKLVNVDISKIVIKNGKTFIASENKNKHIDDCLLYYSYINSGDLYTE